MTLTSDDGESSAAPTPHHSSQFARSSSQFHGYRTSDDGESSSAASTPQGRAPPAFSMSHSLTQDSHGHMAPTSDSGSETEESSPGASPWPQRARSSSNAAPTNEDTEDDDSNSGASSHQGSKELRAWRRAAESPAAPAGVGNIAAGGLSTGLSDSSDADDSSFGTAGGSGSRSVTPIRGISGASDTRAPKNVPSSRNEALGHSSRFSPRGVYWDHLAAL